MIVSNEEVRILAESDPVISAALPTYAVFTMPQALVRPVRNSRRPGPDTGQHYRHAPGLCERSGDAR